MAQALLIKGPLVSGVCCAVVCQTSLSQIQKIRGKIYSNIMCKNKLLKPIYRSMGQRQDKFQIDWSFVHLLMQIYCGQYFWRFNLARNI